MGKKFSIIESRKKLSRDDFINKVQQLLTYVFIDDSFSNCR